MTAAIVTVTTAAVGRVMSMRAAPMNSSKAKICRFVLSVGGLVTIGEVSGKGMGGTRKEYVTAIEGARLRTTAMV